MKAIDIMMEEHKYILRMLKIVRRSCLNILQGEEVNYDDFYSMMEFIRTYADAHHHKKEEKILFRKMVENLGAVGEKVINNGMLVEHDLGRLYIKSLDEALEALKDGHEDAKLDVIANAISYTHLLQRHIEKEDSVIYKFAQRELKEEVLRAIDEQCVEYEKNNEATRDKNINILEKLEKKYIN